MFTCCDCGKDLYEHATVKLLTKENDTERLPLLICAKCCSSSLRNRWPGKYGEICVDGKRMFFKKFPIWKRLYYWFIINVQHKKVD